MIRRFLFKVLIRALVQPPTVPEALSKEQYDGLLSALWQSPAFRKYVADRDAKLIWSLAGGDGFDPEPREKYLMHIGQRVECLLLAREAKQAYTRTLAHQKERSESVIE